MNAKKTLLLLLSLCLLLGALSGCGKDAETQPTEAVGYADKYIDLHLHLDGAITPAIAKILAAKQGIELPTTNDAELAALLQVSEDCTDLTEFLERFALPCSLIQTADGISEAVYQVLEDARAHGVVYAELRFAPSKSCDNGLTQEEAILAALDGLSRSELKANLILCCMRGDDNGAQNEETVELAAKYLVEDGGVVALDLAGAEALFPTEDYRELFALASEKNVPFTIHAGEAAGAESVAAAVEFGAKRIGHGVNSFQDPELMKTLRSKGIYLEMCPTSNRLTHAVEDMSQYPFMDYLEQVILVTLNTDDPAIENTTLAGEFRYMEQTFGLTPAQEKRLLANSVNAAFTTDAVKEQLREELELPYVSPLELAAKEEESEEPKAEPVARPADAVEQYIDLHLHLDGAITPAIAKILAEKQGIMLPAESEKELAEFLQVSEDCGSLGEFLERFTLPCSLLQTAEGISEAVYQVLENARAQGVIYAELRFAPAKCCENGLTQEEAVKAALEGLSRSELKANLILCCMRGEGNEAENGETVELAARYLVKDGGVVALDLAGDEAAYPTDSYQALFTHIADRGVPFTVHAGEAAGADSVRLAVEYGAKRIGHGVRSYEDAELLKELAEKGIYLEMCPSSNRLTHAVEDMSQYPFMDYLAKGVPVTLNTDDPAIENTTLAEEFRYMEETFGLTSAQEKRLLANSINAAFTSEEVKAQLREQLGLPYEPPKEVEPVIIAEPVLESLYPSPYKQGAGENNKIILDTDMYYGNDDAATLFMTLYEQRQGNCKIMGITTVGGNTTVAESTCAVLRTLELLGYTDIPVYMGTDRPLMGFRDMAADGAAYGYAEWYGAYWDSAANTFRDMGHISRDYLHLSTAPMGGYPTTKFAEDGDAVDFIINTIHENPGQVTLFVMGSGANIAAALEKDPTIADDAAGVIYMGGAVDVRGNSTSAAEFNWWYDPAGIQKCLEAGWKAAVLIPNDIAEKVVYTHEVYDAISEKAATSTPAFIISEADFNRFYGDDNTPPYVWDALIALAYFHPDKLTGLEERYIACETTPGYNFGRTVSWWTSRNRDVETGGGMPDNAVKTVILTAIDEEFFWDYYVKGNSWE